jgi:hypothetical protein
MVTLRHEGPDDSGRAVRLSAGLEIVCGSDQLGGSLQTGIRTHTSRNRSDSVRS